MKRLGLAALYALFAAIAWLPSNARAGLISVTNNNSLDGADVYGLSLGDLDNGELVNIDRDHTFSGLPEALKGIDYVLTANDDKTATAAAPTFSVDVTFDAGTRLYLSIDNRVGDNSAGNPPTLGTKMGWVTTQGWTDTGWDWAKANEGTNPFSVYTLLPTGTSHTFYEQDDGGSRNMYSIAGVPEPATFALAAVGLLGLRRRRRRA